LKVLPVCLAQQGVLRKKRHKAMDTNSGKPTSSKSSGRSSKTGRRSPIGAARRSSKLPASTNIKLGLLIGAVLVVLGTLVYSRQLVFEMKQREYKVARLFSDAVRYQTNSEQMDDSLYRLIISFAATSGVPIMLTDGHDVPSVHSFEKFNFNVPFDSTLDSTHQVKFLREQIRQMDKDYAPVRALYVDPESKKEFVTNYIHYGNSLVLGKIEELPLIQLLLGTVIVVIGYLSFSYLKRSEQSNIWVGMAKETAHQLGTPLSSLLGWCELLRLSADDPNEVAKIADEIERDVERLNRIAVRFSKIGSYPDLKSQNVVSIISEVMGYFEGRMPHLRRQIRLELMTTEDEILAPLNRELFEWVMENLIKNAFEAIEAPEGLIRIYIHKNPREDHLLIDVSDTGKGFDMRRKKDIFRPGFSTKSRGWGLGLSLSKRIIEEYHHGKLFVKESAPGVGTTFRIRLVLEDGAKA
jgi:signal transduction histidine kinase